MRQFLSFIELFLKILYFKDRMSRLRVSREPENFFYQFFFLNFRSKKRKVYILGCSSFLTMVWSRNCPADNKPRYIRKEGNFVILTKDKRKATEDSIPEGWEVVVTPNDYLKLVKKR